MEDPVITLIVSLVLLGVLGKLWLTDYKANASGQPHPKALPGAWPCPGWIIALGVVGALALVGLETAGEYALGVSQEQSTVAWLAIIPWLCAGFVEELVFRGYLVVEKRGRAVLIASILGFSVLFALIHVQYWLDFDSEDSFAKLDWTTLSSWSLFILFANSVWFYTLRFLPANSKRSLIPCFAAHAASNLGVFLVKLAQGHVEGLLHPPV